MKDPELFELEARRWLLDRTIEEALEEAEITEEDCLMILLQLGYIKIPPWLDMDTEDDGL